MATLPDLGDADALRDWHTSFRAIREHQRMYWDDAVGAWLVTRHADVEMGLYDHRLSSQGPTSFMAQLSAEDLAKFADLQRFYESWMVFSNEPYHTVVRGSVQRVLTPRAVQKRQEAVRAAARSLLDRARAEVVDVNSDFARPLATAVISEVLGVPEQEWDNCSRWSHHIIDFISAPQPDASRAMAAAESYDQMCDYVYHLVEEHRRTGRDDSPMLAVADVGAHAVVGTFAQFMTGGCDPISAAIANAVATLLAHPDQMQRLERDRSLIPTAIEEFIRYESPFTLVPRVVTEPMTVAGQHLHEGSRVLFMLLAANRDPGVFERPDEVDVGRSPNPHLGFGKGSHYCIGAGLARLEMTESIEAIIDMSPNLELAGQVEWSSSLGLRSAVKLPVSVSR